MFKPWMKLAVDTTLLGLEAQRVMGMRLSQIALGRVRRRRRSAW
jgi:hypothetical protein